VILSELERLSEIFSDTSVCLSHAGILSKRLNISSNCFHNREATPFQFILTKRQYSDPITGSSNAGVRKKS